MHVGLVFDSFQIWIAPKSRPKMALKMTSKRDPNLEVFLGLFLGPILRGWSGWRRVGWPKNSLKK